MNHANPEIACIQFYQTSSIDYIDVKEQIYMTTDLLLTEKLQLQFICKILLPRVAKKYRTVFPNSY